MNWANLFTMLGFHVVGMSSPGPDIFLVLRTATRSRRHALAAVAGIVTGSTLWVTLTVLGVAAVMSANPAIMAAIQLLGGLYLGWMAWSMLSGGLRGVRELRAGAAPPPVEVALGSVAGAFRTGLLTNLSNPKIVLFFTAVLSQFMPVGASWWVQLVYVLALQICAALWFGLIAVVVSTERMTRRMLAAGPWIDVVAGVLFAVLAAVMLWEAATALLG
ncbi:LysE family translocator [Corynebacterium sp.]|uniref:LysE family translocator n=1 Tax=Corynebacterium sp. TaxID=1720 RepID=UPI0026DD989C|nr:LysE family translocator [Corynebacterium sp.]MDO4610302.1 LysE family translocator [Corynebacterium sp.]